MKLSIRLFLGYFILVAIAGQWVLMIVIKQIEPGMRTALEASLVDTAYLLAEFAAADLSTGHLADGGFAQAVKRYAARPVDAQIFDFAKRSLDYRVYVTDSRGIVQFDSAGTALGADYSRWNDVYLTLRGHYGARSSLADPADAKSSIMHVAAPVRRGNDLIGVLTVAYPAKLLQPVVDNSEAQVWHGALWLYGAALAFGGLFSWRLTRAIDLLVAYAHAVTIGEKASPPKLRSVEMASLAKALETMREELEGRQYAERYVQTLTHEMKSPLAAIRGSAELLQEPLPDEQRQRFANHVTEQAQRLDRLIEKMLGLAAVEQRQQLAETVDLNLAELLAAILQEKTPQCALRGIRFELHLMDALHVRGEEFLLHQAVSNLLDNAIEFSQDNGLIEIGASKAEGQVVLTIRDYGAGIPTYALERLFERFYSLPRPLTGKKSTGLGLAFVREVMQLHQGDIRIANADGGGVEATLVFYAD
jgi:two-component system sensor histidine kinase CreC